MSTPSHDDLCRLDQDCADLKALADQELLEHGRSKRYRAFEKARDKIGRKIIELESGRRKPNPSGPHGTREVPFLVTELPGESVASSKRTNPVRAPRYKISLVKEAGSMYVTSKPIHSGAMIFEQASTLFEDIDREAFYIICLDGKLKVIGVNLVSLGTLNASLVHPREVFKAAILLNAAAIICAHNHPGGDPFPSGQDRDLTQRLVTAGVLLGIFIKDHVVIGDKSYYSFADHDLIAAYEAYARSHTPT